MRTKLGLALFTVVIALWLPSQVVLAQTHTVTFQIEGMTCGGCSTSISEALNRLDGVVHAEVSFDERRARIQHDPARITEARLMEVIRELGFRVQVAGS